MKHFLVLVVSIMLTTHLLSQNSIRAKITDTETHEPVYGATVYISDLKTGASADTNGNFLIRNIPKGTFLAEIRMIGYASRAVMLESKPEQEWNKDSIPEITLTKTPAEYHPVIVTGISGSSERMRNPVPATMDTREHLLKHASTNIVAAISEIPGVSSVNTGSAISKPVIRGLGYNRVIVLRNNLRQEGQQWGDEHGVEIDEYEIDRIEIIKGPGSIMYGSDAMAGVINFMTPQPVQEGKISGEIMSGYQTNSCLFGNSVMQQGNINGVSWQLRFSQKKAGNFRTPADGYVANSGFEEWDGSGFIGLNRKWGVSQISFSTFNQKIGMPEGDRDSVGHFVIPVLFNDTTESTLSLNSNELQGYDHSIGIPFQKVRHHRIAFTNNIFFRDSKLKVDIGFQQNSRVEFGNIFDPAEEEIHFTLNTINSNIVYFFPEKNQWQLTTGINTQHQDNENTGSDFIIPEYSMNDAGLFIYTGKYFNKWFFSAGFRTDLRLLDSKGLYLDSLGVPVEQNVSVQEKFSPFTRNFISYSGVVGTSYQFNKTTVARINFSRGFRTPNLAELAANGKHEGTFRYEKGNAQLLAETSYQVDAGLTLNSDHFNVEVSGFYNGINNYIFLTKILNTNGADSIINPSDPAPLYTYTQGNAILSGGELFTDLHPHPFDWLHFENSFSFVRGILLNQNDSMRNLPFMPPAKFQSEINAHMEKKRGPFAGAFFRFSVTSYFSQDKIFSAYNTETTTPGYILMDAGAGSDIVSEKGKVMLRVFISVNNLLDTDYQSHLNRLKYAPVNPLTGKTGISNPGRNFSFRIIIPFAIK